MECEKRPMSMTQIHKFCLLFRSTAHQDVLEEIPGLLDLGDYLRAQPTHEAVKFRGAQRTGADVREKYPLTTASTHG